MLGVDTNVLIRFLTLDDEVQSAQATRLFAQTRNRPIHISMLVLAEAFTVMTKVKKHSAAAVLESYRLLLRSPAVDIERPDLVFTAIEDASRTRAEFSDALIALQHADARCSPTATFNIRAMRLGAMSPVKDFL